MNEKKKLSKLTLKKDVVSALSNDQMKFMHGGGTGGGHGNSAEGQDWCPGSVEIVACTTTTQPGVYGGGYGISGEPVESCPPMVCPPGETQAPAYGCDAYTEQYCDPATSLFGC